MKTLSKEFGNHISSTISWCLTATNYTNYGLRSNISPPQNPALTSFENDIYDIVKNIEFRNVRNNFQGKLKEDINRISFSKNLFVFADKSTNLYKMSDADYNRILSSNITSNYRE